MFLDQPNESVNEIVILLPPDSLVTPSLYISYTVSGCGVQEEEIYEVEIII